MKITIVCDVLGAQNNGTTVAAMNLITYLRTRGHDVTVVCPDEDKRGMPGYVIADKLSFGPFNGYVEKNGVVISRPDADCLRTALAGADVMHIVTPFFLAQKAMHIAMEEGIPFTASFHCQAENISSHLFMMNSEKFNHSIYKYFYRAVYCHAAAVHYPTQFICDTFESAVGHTTNHDIISNGVNRRFRRAAAAKPASLGGRYAVLFTGRYSREKSHRVLIDAVAMSRDPERIQLIFAGAGPREEALRKYCAEKLTVQPIFRFFSREEMLEVLNYSDLYVHPAEIEIEAIACLEAIKCGLVPVISDSPRSATRAFALDERNLFRCNDPSSLAERIDWWLDHPVERENCRQRYLGYVTQFDQDVCMERMEGMLLDVIGHKTANASPVITREDESADESKDKTGINKARPNRHNKYRHKK